MQNLNDLQSQYEDVFKNKTYRQIAGDMLDNAFEVIKIYIDQTVKDDMQFYSSKNMKEDLMKAQKDLYGALNFFISTYDRLMKNSKKESKFLKSLLFELKHFRNNWAHSKDFTLRELYRIQDTILLVFDELDLQIQSNFYAKGQFMREMTAIKLGEESKQKIMQQYQEQQQQLINAQQQQQSLLQINAYQQQLIHLPQQYPYTYQ